jgi:ubiquinone/menaquinone biosynthesis C-methylase UbiE
LQLGELGQRCRPGARGMKDVQRQFGKTAAAYITSPTHAASEDLDRLVALARDHGGERVVDVGTGVGHTLRRVAPHFRGAIGLDATREMLAAGRGVLAEAGVENALLVQADARAMPLSDAAFDVATCRVAAHHFTEPARAFAEIARVLRPGGILVLVDNYAPDEPELDAFINTLETLRDASHVRNHTLDGWRALVEDAGMRVTIDSSGMATKLSTEAWLSRSQTPADRAQRVRAMLREAPAATVKRFRITATDFGVPKVVLVGTR